MLHHSHWRTFFNRMLFFLVLVIPHEVDFAHGCGGDAKEILVQENVADVTLIPFDLPGLERNHGQVYGEVFFLLALMFRAVLFRVPILLALFVVSNIVIDILISSTIVMMIVS